MLEAKILMSTFMSVMVYTLRMETKRDHPVIVLALVFGGLGAGVLVGRMWDEWIGMGVFFSCWLIAAIFFPLSKEPEPEPSPEEIAFFEEFERALED
jgi:hypothetical protein